MSSLSLTAHPPLAATKDDPADPFLAALGPVARTLHRAATTQGPSALAPRVHLLRRPFALSTHAAAALLVAAAHTGCLASTRSLARELDGVLPRGAGLYWLALTLQRQGRTTSAASALDRALGRRDLDPAVRPWLQGLRARPMEPAPAVALDALRDAVRDRARARMVLASLSLGPWGPGGASLARSPATVSLVALMGGAFALEHGLGGPTPAVLARLHGLTTLGALALAFGLARHTRSAWRAALVALARRALDESFGLLGLVAAVALAGSLHAHDLADAQGGAPWRWIALQGPWTAFLALTVVAAAVRATEPGVALDLRAHAAALAWVFARGLIFAVVFLGAWRVPGWSAAAQEASPGASMLGALLLVAKAWAFVAVVYALRARAAHVTAARWSRMALRTVLPTAVLCLGVTTTLALGGQSLGATVQDVVARTASGATLALALLGAATLLVRRLRPARTLGYVPQP